MTAKVYRFPTIARAAKGEASIPVTEPAAPESAPKLVELFPAPPVKLEWRWSPKLRRYRSHTTGYAVFLGPTSFEEDATLRDPEGKIVAKGPANELYRKTVKLVQDAKRLNKRAFPRA